MQAISKLRWWIFGLLLLLNMVNNLDRQVFALVAPTLQHQFGWSELDYGRMVGAFQISFALMSLTLGWVIDRLGARLSMTLAILWFSIAQLLHVIARTPASFLGARIGLALGEAPVYPATLKALAEWAPMRERGSAAGLVHFGVMIGAIVAPLIIPWMTVNYGWYSGFVLTGVLGLLALIPWMILYARPEDHPRISAGERNLIIESRPEPPTQEPVQWLRLFGHRELWVYVAIQAIVNPAWWFLTYWLPKFLGEVFAIRGVALTPYVTVVFVMAAVGAIGGGSFSGLLMARGLSRNAARKFTMLACGLVMPAVIVAVYTRLPWLAVFVIGIAAVIHQTWTTTGAAILADLFPPRAVASVVGIGSFFGSLAGVVGAELTGRVLQAHGGDYAPMFIYTGFCYLLTVLVVQLLSPRLERAQNI